MPIPSPFASPRAALLTVFAAFGVAVGAIAGSMPIVTRTAAIDNTTLGFVLTCYSLANVATMALGGQMARRLTNRTALLIALPLFALFLLATLVAPNALLFGAGYMAVGVAMGLLDLFMNAEGAAIEIDLRRPVFTAFHGSASTGLMLMGVVASFLATRLGPWAAGLLAALVFGAGWLLTACNVAPRSLAGGRRPKSGAPVAHRLALTLLGTVAGLSIAAETTAILWSAKLLDAQAPQLAAIAGLGAAFFGLCNAVVRFVGDALRERFGDLPLMRGSIIVACTGFVILGAAQRFSTSVAGFALIGLGTAVLVPCVFALAARQVPENRAGGIAYVSLVAGVPRVLAPWTFGAIVTATSLTFAFGLYAGVMAVAFGLVVWLARLR